MSCQHDWEEILQTDWMLFKTSPFLSIRDLRSFSAVNTKVKNAINLCLDSLPGNFTSLLGHKAFSVLVSFLPLDDLTTLNSVSKGCRFSIRVYSTSLSHEVRGLISAFCDARFAYLMHSAEIFPPENRDVVLYHPPFLKLSLGRMAIDNRSMTLKGQPLEEVEIHDMPLPNLGRAKPFACASQDSGSEIFYCGGETFVEGDHHERWGWISRERLSFDYSKTTGLFDGSTGTWRHLPQMPEARSGGIACRIGKKVFLFGGAEPETYLFGVGLHSSRPEFVLIFDLQEERWITDHGIGPFPGAYDECHAAATSTHNIIIFSRFQVFSLNTLTGEWNNLPKLPMKVGSILACRIVKHLTRNEQILVAVGKKSWAKLILTNPGGSEDWDQHWVIEPDLRCYDLKIMRIHKDKMQLFSGNSWTLMESQNMSTSSFYGGHLGEFNLSMAFCLVGYYQN